MEIKKGFEITARAARARQQGTRHEGVSEDIEDVSQLCFQFANFSYL
jgi:hypothetical protein